MEECHMRTFVLLVFLFLSFVIKSSFWSSAFGIECMLVFLPCPSSCPVCMPYVPRLRVPSNHFGQNDENFIDMVYRGSSRPRLYVRKVAVNEPM